jgi:hypothetical protein
MRRRSSSLTPSACVFLERPTSQRVTLTNCSGSIGYVVGAANSDVLSDSKAGACEFLSKLEVP